jgi:hypothetical protein
MDAECGTRRRAAADGDKHGRFLAVFHDGLQFRVVPKRVLRREKKYRQKRRQ